MKNLKIKLVALALGLAFSPGALAQGAPKHDFAAGQERVTVEFKPAGALVRKVNASTMVDVPSAKADALGAPARKQATAVRIDAMYEVEKVQCNTRAVADKAHCLREMKAGFGK